MNRRDLLCKLPVLGVATVAPTLFLKAGESRTKAPKMRPEVHVRIQPFVHHETGRGYFVAKYTYPMQNGVRVYRPKKIKCEYLRADGSWLEVPEMHVLPTEVLLTP